MQFIRERIAGQFAGKANGRMFDALGDLFNPVIYGAAQELYRYLPEESAERRVSGDLFVTPSRDIFYYCFSPNCDSLVAGSVCNSVRAQRDWGKFRGAISKAIGSDDWKSDLCASEAFCALSEDTTPLVINEWERRSALALKRPELREMLKLIASRGSVSLQDVAGNRDMLEVSSDVQLLEELSIITREFVVYCVETNQKVSCVSNFAAIEEAAQRGFKCFHCGRPISQEKIVQVLSITESGRRLAAKNIWLAYLVGATLCDAGIAPESIAFRSEHDNEIVEVFADVQGSMVMFEVSEQEITADVAFRFLNRSKYFNPQWGYLVTPLEVGGDARAVIASSAEHLSVVSNLSELPDVIRHAVLIAGQKMLTDLLETFNEYTELEIGSWASKYLIAECQEPVKCEKIAPAVDGNVAEASPEAVKAEDVKDDESSSSSESESKSSESESSSATFGTPPSVSGEIDIPAPEPVVPSIASVVSECSGASCHEVTQRVLSLLPNALETNEIDAVSALIEGVADRDDCSIMIAGSDGTPFLGGLHTMNDSDLVAALQVDLLQNLEAISINCGLGTVQGVLMCNDDSTLRIAATIDGYGVVTHCLAPEIAAVHGERRKSSPKLRKALQNLAGLPGVNGSLVLKAEGGLVQAIGFSEEGMGAKLAEFSSQMVNDCIKGFCEDIGFDGLRACMLHTDKTVVHVLLIDSNHYLVTELSLKVADYVWRSDLSVEAGTVLANL